MWDEDLRYASHNLIQWDQYPTYDGEFITFSGSLLGDAVLSSGTIEEASRDSYGNFHIYSVSDSEFTGNISSPCQNRPPHYPGDTIAHDYRLESRSFTVKFRFPKGLGNPSDYFVDVWGYQDETRTPVIWKGFERDRLGYARIRTRITATPLPADTQPLPPETQETRCLLISNPDLYRQLKEIPWARDGFSETENGALEWLISMAYENKESTATVIALPWLQDNITETEAEAISRLGQLNYRSAETAAAILDMPFLKSLEFDDVLAIRGIQRLAFNKDDSLLPTLMDHPTLRNGITDDLTTLVAAVGTIRDAEEINRMLSPGYADIETLSTATELTPDLKISIVRPGTQRQPQTMAATKDALLFAEKTMQLPLPLSHVLMVLNDEAVGDNGAPANFGFAFSGLPRHEQALGAKPRQTFYSIIVHEVAHYYWHLDPDWVDEGVAVIFEYMQGVQAGVSPGLLEEYPRRTHNAECEAHDLQMISEWNPTPVDWEKFWCNYFLGRMLFLELLESLGGEEFSERLRLLHRLSLAAIDDGKTPSIAEVRQAFHDQSEIVEKHWSGELNAPENRPPDKWDELILHSSQNLIQWDQHPTYDGEFVTFSGTVLDDAVLSSGTIEEANRDSYGNFHIYSVDDSKFTGYISSPGLNRSPREPGDVTALEYRLEDRTFTVRFRFPQKLGDPSDYFVDVWGFQDESRTPVIWEGFERDRLGYARIRVE